ncbi:reverse transcriptase domain-containing protein [Bradyrhizobium sp. USDA 4474]
MLNADIRSFFDSVDHEWLLRMVAQRIADPRILRLIGLWLPAGVLESGEKQETDRGTPQGAGISPLLANIFLHYILDLWVHQWRRRHSRGRIVTARYADDFVTGFESKADAQEMLLALKARLASFGLTLHENKTPDRVWPVRGPLASAARRAATGDLRLPRLLSENLSGARFDRPQLRKTIAARER